MQFYNCMNYDATGLELTKSKQTLFFDTKQAYLTKNVTIAEPE